MAHQVIHLQKWIERFPLEHELIRLDAEKAKDFQYFPPIDLFKPRDLAHHMQWVRRAGFDQAPSVEVDYFVPALGESPTRSESKISGLPYLRKADWPVDENNRPLAFLGQICFTDSWDFLSVDKAMLGGDILLIFQNDPEEMIWSTEFGSQLTFIWMNHGAHEADLATQADLWTPEGWYEPTHFHRFRAQESDAEERLVTHSRGFRFLSKRIRIPVSYSLRATKIGGIPVWQQDEAEHEGLGKYLCCLHSINPYGKEQPFINVAEAPWGNRYCPKNLLMLGDVGTLYLFLTESGEINWLMQCG